MANPVLVVMAAGMGSRYGGLKQIDPVGPNGQIIMHYSIYDAWKAGFRRVVFIIKEELLDAFRERIGNAAEKLMQVDYVFQSPDKLPEGCTMPEGRTKPLGTGHAMVTRCYNTCFLLSGNGERLLVDAGGGNGILVQLEKAGVSVDEIHTIYVTHKHVDHVMGVIWMIRTICQNINRGTYRGTLTVCAHQELLDIIRSIVMMLIREKETRHIGSRVLFVPVADGEEREILGHKTVFFDVRSVKAKQFGFSMFLPCGKFTCLGDEPLSPSGEPYARGSAWLMHEAFCLESQSDIFTPHEKLHSTVKEACENAARMGVENLILYHTEDRNLPRRRELYTEEGRAFFGGRIYVPDDLDRITIC